MHRQTYPAGCAIPCQNAPPAQAHAPVSYTHLVAELVTDDPSVKPPQTGDNASIVGFVMIAIALVAAAAVTVKKVRA